MILRRLGNKQRIAQDIIKYFPKHEIFIDMFFGGGGLFFSKPKSKYNFLNDIDKDVINLFNVLIEKPNELKEYLELIPYGIDYFEQIKNEVPKNEIQKAVYFLVFSNWTFLGTGGMLKYEIGNNKKITIDRVITTYKFLVNEINTQFLNFDFRELLPKIHYRNEIKEKNKTFIYADKPYSDTINNYSTDWTNTDDFDLLNVLEGSGIKYAVSEFEGSNFEKLALEKGLHKIYIGERQNLKNRRTEILITNYQVAPDLFSGCS